jgi:squalene-hopene/tetraprenyl-beta-curcumene cyclase
MGGRRNGLPGRERIRPKACASPATPACPTCSRGPPSGPSSTKPPAPYETGLLDAVKKRIPTFGTTPAEPVLTALLLAEQDARRGSLSRETEQVFEGLWPLQIASGPSQGAWNWNNTGRDPFSAPYGQFYGAALAALAVGVAPEGYQSRPQIQENLAALKTYLADQRKAQPLHNRVILVWASTKLGGLLTDADRKAIVNELAGKQQADGGWTLDSLGPWSKHADAPAAKGSNAYATGLAAFVLERASVSAADPKLGRALQWLRSHQDKSGFWEAQSMNTHYEPGTMPSQFMRDVATSFAVLALIEAR